MSAEDSWARGAAEEGAKEGRDVGLFDFLADLEARAGAVLHRDRAEQVRDRARTAYAEVTLESRLMASLDATVSCEVRGVGRLSGTVSRVGAGWCEVATTDRTWCLDVSAVRTLRGASARAVPREAWHPADRLGLPSVLRRLAEEERQCVVHLDDGARREGVVTRVGADFFEVARAGDPSSGSPSGQGSGDGELLALAGVSALSWPDGRDR